MHKLSVVLLFVVLAQAAYSELLLEGGDVVIRAKRSETIEGSGIEGSGEVVTQAQIEGSGQTVVEGSGVEASGAEPTPIVASSTVEPSLLSETLTKEDTKPAEEIAV